MGDSVEVITLTSSDEDSSLEVKNSLNKKTEVNVEKTETNGKQTARKSMQSNMGAKISTSLKLKSEASSSQSPVSNLNKVNASASTLGLTSAEKKIKLFSSVKKSIKKPDNVIVLKSNAITPGSNTRSKTDIQVTPTNSSGLSSNKSASTLNKKVAFHSVNGLTNSSSLISNKEPSNGRNSLVKEKFTSSRLVNNLPSGIQITSTKSDTSLQQAAKVTPDSNKCATVEEKIVLQPVHSSTSFSNQTSKKQHSKEGNSLAKEKPIISQLVNRLPSGIQITSTKSNTSSNSFQQAVKVMPDSNKSVTTVKEKIVLQPVYSSTSSSSELSQKKHSNGNNSVWECEQMTGNVNKKARKSFRTSNENSNGNNCVTAGIVNKKARKSFQTSNVNIPASLLSSFGKSGISIVNINTSNSTNSHESVSEDVKKSVSMNKDLSFKLLNKTIPSVSITEVKPNRLSVSEPMNNKIESMHGSKFIQNSVDESNVKISTQKLPNSNKDQVAETIFFSSSDEKVVISKRDIPDNKHEISMKKLPTNQTQNRDNYYDCSKTLSTNNSIHSDGNTDLSKRLASVHVNQNNVISNESALKLNSNRKVLDLNTCMIKKNVVPKSLETTSINMSQKPGISIFPVDSAGSKSISILKKSNLPDRDKKCIMKMPVKRKGNITSISAQTSKKACSQKSGIEETSERTDVLPQPSKIEQSSSIVTKYVSKSNENSNSEKCQVIPLPYVTKITEEEAQEKMDAIKKSLKTDALPQPSKIEQLSSDVTKYVSKPNENCNSKKCPVIPLPYVTKITEEGAQEREEIKKSLGRKEMEKSLERKEAERSPESTEMEKTPCKEVSDESKTEKEATSGIGDENKKLAVATEKPHKQVTSPKLSLKRKTEAVSSSDKKLKVDLNVNSAKEYSLQNPQNNHFSVSITTDNKVFVEDQVPWHCNDDNSVKFTKFLQFCRPHMECPISEADQIIQILMKLFERAEPIYVKSTGFIHLLEKIIKSKPSSSNIFVHLKTVKNELRANKKKDNFSSSSSEKSEITRKIPNAVFFSRNKIEKISAPEEKNNDISSLSYKLNDGKENASGTYISEKDEKVSTTSETQNEEKRSDYPSNSLTPEPSRFSDAEDVESSPSLLSSIPNECNDNKNVFLNNFYLGPSTSKQADLVELALVESRSEEKKKETEGKKNRKITLMEPNDTSNHRTFITELENKCNHETFTQMEDENSFETPLTETESKRKQISSDSTEAVKTEKNISTLGQIQIDRRIKKLENFLGKLSRKIEKLSQKELSLDDLDDDDSVYLLEDRLKRKFNDIWAKLCTYKKCSKLIGRKMEKRFTYAGSRYQSINKAVERLVNKRKPAEKFPNYVEILEIVRKKNEEEDLGICDGEDEELAKQIFKDVGRELQDRRKRDIYEDIHNYLPENFDVYDNDPADKDESLKFKLSNNYAECEKKLNEIMEKYTKKQKDEEDKNPQKVLEVEDSTESEHSDIPETEPATPSTDERIIDSEPEIEVSKSIECEQKEKEDNDKDIIDIGSSSDASTEPGSEAYESRKSYNNPSLLNEAPVFISDDIEIIDDSDDSPGLPEL
ncbi:death domain-associated protein 6 [Nephila pilipes]|uniref:Death domain-associated protein 6 n=1 Tax=Nephila pilipes TaxID=299642 RepID=A0A8X6T3X4_NEPPI|nr:death domain-associated protein 6 [Nephila pilipes]